MRRTSLSMVVISCVPSAFGRELRERSFDREKMKY